jgi:hypothetical protein
MHEVCELQVPISGFAVPGLGRILSSSDLRPKWLQHARPFSARFPQYAVESGSQPCAGYAGEGKACRGRQYEALGHREQTTDDVGDVCSLRGKPGMRSPGVRTLTLRAGLRSRNGNCWNRTLAVRFRDEYFPQADNLTRPSVPKSANRYWPLRLRSGDQRRQRAGA